MGFRERRTFLSGLGTALALSGWQSTFVAAAQLIGSPCHLSAISGRSERTVRTSGPGPWLPFVAGSGGYLAPYDSRQIRGMGLRLALTNSVEPVSGET
jgi:hypothetical protein